MLVQRRRRWANIVQMLYKCFVFDENGKSEIDFESADSAIANQRT